MPEFFTVLTPDDALATLWRHRPAHTALGEEIPTAEALGRVTQAAVTAPEARPAFARSAMDGYAVRAQDTFGASQTLPAYLIVAGEAPMGRAPAFSLAPGQVRLSPSSPTITFPAGRPAPRNQN